MGKPIYSAAVGKEMDEKLTKVREVLFNSKAIDSNTRYALTRFALDLLATTYDKCDKINNGGDKNGK